ncbi:MAG: aldo/keto reductase [Victivallales bacterium]|nr:aldo/keto reductase [Victivallales bacterium]
MNRTLLTMAITMTTAVFGQTEKVTYIKPPVFEGQIYLYGQPKPGDAEAEQWYEIEGRGQFVRNVKTPTLIPYLPERGRGNGAAIIIAPGGAFLHHTFGSGGYEAADWFRRQGFATFILKYRVEETPRDEAEYQAYVQKKMAGYIAGGKSGNYAPATPDYAIEDANAAVRLVRARAPEFGVSPDRIGIVGFSAGALMAVYNAECAPAGDRADFIASIYGQLVLRDMPDKLPPLFAAMSSDDPLSGQSGFEVIQAWQKRGVAELHLYGQGGHNFGMGHTPFTSALWPGQFMAWLKMLGLLRPAPENTVPGLQLNNGTVMPQFGIGTFNQGSDDVCYASVLTALRAGYRHIDTAHAYQDERGVGRAVRQFCQESGVPRSQIWVTSKLWPTEYGAGVSAQAIDRMLERLQLDYIDLLYVHQPAGDYLGAWREMENAVAQGKVRTLGVSDFDYDDHMLDDLVAAVKIKPAVLQIECHPYAQRIAMRQKAAWHGIQVETWFPLGGGGKGNESLLNNPTIVDIARMHGKTPAQIILRWHVQEGFSVIPGSKNPAHICENIDVFDFELDGYEMQRIRALNTESRFYIPQASDLERFLEFKPAD